MSALYREAWAQSAYPYAYRYASLAFVRPLSARRVGHTCCPQTTPSNMTTTNSKAHAQKKRRGPPDGRLANLLTAPRTQDLLDKVAALFAGIPAQPVLSEARFLGELKHILDDAYKRGGFVQEMEDRLATLGYRMPMSFYKNTRPVRRRSRQQASTTNFEGAISAAAPNAFAVLSERSARGALQRRRSASIIQGDVPESEQPGSEDVGSNAGAA